MDITASGAFDGGLDLALELLAGSDEVDAVVIVSSLASETPGQLRRGAAAAAWWPGRSSRCWCIYSYTRPSALACTELSQGGAGARAST